MKYITIICLFLFNIGIYAQDTICPCLKELHETLTPALKGEIYRGKAGIVGSEFFNPEYQTGDIILEQGDIIKNQQLRYNGRIDGVLFLPQQSSKEILLDKYFVKGFCIKNFNKNSEACFYKIKIDKGLVTDSSTIYGQILYHGKLSLYVFRQYTFQDEVQEIINSVRITKQEYGPAFIYYFQLPNGKTIGFKKFRKRDLYKLFPGNKELMRKLFKEKHQHRFRKEDDLIRITEILNALY